MNCPVCKEIELRITDRQGIEIDYCPQCRGIWLDRGELDKLIERSAQAAPPATPQAPSHEYAPPPQQPQPRYEKPRYRDDDYDDDDYKYRKRRKKGGWLEDLFDFD